MVFAMYYMTFQELDRKPPMSPVIVTQRLSGATNVSGELIRMSPQIKEFPPIAYVQFHDGVEHVPLGNIISISSKKQKKKVKTDKPDKSDKFDSIGQLALF